MEWKAIPGFPNYVANRNGQIKSLLRGGRILKSNVSSTGYPMVNMKDENGKWAGRLVHVVIATAFIGPRPDGMDCCHNDGNKLNAAASNLRWDTRKANLNDQRIHGTFAWHGKKKLSPEQVIEAAERIAAGEKCSEIAADYGVNRATIGAVSRGANWSELTGMQAGEGRERARGHKLKGILKDEDVLEIVRRIDAGERQMTLAAEFGVRPQTISCINRGLAWAWLTGRGKDRLRIE